MFAKDWEVPHDDPECGPSIYLYADTGYVQSYHSLGFWDMCPAYYSRFNQTGTLELARIADDAATWISKGATAYALDGEEPSNTMKDLILLCVEYWNKFKLDAKIKALENGKTQINLGGK